MGYLAAVLGHFAAVLGGFFCYTMVIHPFSWVLYTSDAAYDSIRVEFGGAGIIETERGGRTEERDGGQQRE